MKILYLNQEMYLIPSCFRSLVSSALLYGFSAILFARWLLFLPLLFWCVWLSFSFVHSMCALVCILRGAFFSPFNIGHWLCWINVKLSKSLFSKAIRTLYFRCLFFSSHGVWSGVTAKNVMMQPIYTPVVRRLLFFSLLAARIRRNGNGQMGSADCDC